MLRHALLAVAASVALPGAANAGTTGHSALLATVTTYRPIQGFSQIVGDKRFIGYFLPENGACSVTVMVALVNDERLVVTPQRVTLTIKAADRAEVAAGNGDALGIACTADADRIVVAPLTLPHPEAPIN